MEEPKENGFLSNGNANGFLRNGNAERTSRSRSAADDLSSAIAEKLLQGWALLGDHCPQCVTPLVRNRERRMYCVSCLQWVINERDAASQILENHVHISQNLGEAETVNDPVTENENIDNQPPRMTAPAPAQQIETEARPNHLSNFRHPNERLLETTQTAVPSAAAESIPNDIYSVSRLSPLVGVPSNTGAVLSQTLYVLVHKIEEMSQLIAITREPQNLKQLLETIEHCMRVMEQIKAFGTTCMSV